MASKNPLGPLKLKTEKPSVVTQKVLKCPQCGSQRLQDYGGQNGIGYTCKKCNYHWAIGRTSFLNVEQKRQFLQEYNRQKEDNIIKYSEDFAVTAEEYDRIEETIASNNDFFKRRLYGE